MALICFDWDGTIADTWPLYITAAQRYCAANDLHIPDETELRYSFGNPHWEGYPKWPGSKDDHWQHRRNLYAQLDQLAEEKGPYKVVPFIQETINFCLENNFKVAIVTSRPRNDLLSAVAKCKWEKIFSSYITSTCAHEKGMKDKPAPDMIDFMIKQHSELPGSAVMVGDMVHDIAMAQSAKCHSIAVTWGAGDPNKLKQLNPTAICSDPSQLGKTISRLVSV